MPYSLEDIRRGKIKIKTIKICHIATQVSGKSKQNGTVFYAPELGSQLMYSWSWSLKAFETDFDDTSTYAQFIKKICIILMHLSMNVFYRIIQCMYVLRDARNLEWFSQVPFSLLCLESILKNWPSSYQRISIQKLSLSKTVVGTYLSK